MRRGSASVSGCRGTVSGTIRYYPLHSKPCENPGENSQCDPLLPVTFFVSTKIRSAINYYPLSATLCVSVPETACTDPLSLLCDRDR
jgi:hypothetical protein